MGGESFDLLVVGLITASLHGVTRPEAPKVVPASFRSREAAETASPDVAVDVTGLTCPAPTGLGAQSGTGS